MKQYNFNINGNSYEVTINSVEGNVADVTVKTSYKVELGKAAVCAEATPAIQPAPAAQTVAAPVTTAPAPAPAAEPTAQTPAPSAGGAGKKVVAPLPGNIVAINVKVGDAVKAGQQVAVLEAMKMENSIESPADGTVTEILANVGDALAAEAPIMTIG
ncbi:MAG: biotin/lipoyl-binding protein [Bacteroidales bacterium]|nr:biotin/lipoyl-binding protein [Bacteroidales bacterium]